MNDVSVNYFKLCFLSFCFIFCIWFITSHSFSALSIMLVNPNGKCHGYDWYDFDKLFTDAFLHLNLSLELLLYVVCMLNCKLQSQRWNLHPQKSYSFGWYTKTDHSSYSFFWRWKFLIFKKIKGRMLGYWELRLKKEGNMIIYCSLIKLYQKLKGKEVGEAYYFYGKYKTNSFLFNLFQYYAKISLFTILYFLVQVLWLCISPAFTQNLRLYIKL